jgi:hypothetical protein
LIATSEAAMPARKSRRFASTRAAASAIRSTNPMSCPGANAKAAGKEQESAMANRVLSDEKSPAQANKASADSESRTARAVA